ncbi:MAG: TonB-dependent receptor [Candidatus Competibacter denitrificans]
MMMESMLFVLFILFFGFSLSVDCIAADGDSPIETKSLSPEIVLTPSRLPQRLAESASTITLIDRAMIEASGARRLVDVLRLVPGFQVGYKRNALPTAAYHGLTDEYSRRILLLVNGQRIFQYARGVITWNNLPVSLENIERIEVIRGPDAAAYGSNALEAVINIQTGNASEYPGLSSRLTVGSNGVSEAFVRHGGRFGALNYMASFSTTGDTGYDSLADDRRNSIFSLLGEMPLAGGELQLQTGLAYGLYDTEEPPVPAVRGDAHFSETNHFQTVKWRKTIDTDNEWAVTVSHNFFDYRDPGYLVPTQKGITFHFAQGIKEERYEMDFQFFHRFSETFRSIFGGGYYDEQVYAPGNFDTDNHLSNTVSWLNGHLEYRLSPQSIINLGAMVEQSSLTSDWLFLPRVSFHHHFDSQQTVRVGYATGSRQPTLYENNGRAAGVSTTPPLKTYAVIATGGLNSETNRSVEVGYHREKERSQIDARFFRDRYSHYIGTYYRPVSGILTLLPGKVLDFANESPIQVQGMELQGDWTSGVGTRLFGSYAFTHINADGTRFNAGYEPSAPRHGVGLLVSQDLGAGWQFSLNYDYQSKMQWYRDAPIAAYHQLGARLAKRGKLHSTTFVAELVGTNLLGPLEDYLPTQSWDRTVFFRLSLDQ